MDKEFEHPDRTEVSLAIGLYIAIVSEQLEESQEPISLSSDICESKERSRAVILLNKTLVSTGECLITFSAGCRIS